MIPRKLHAIWIGDESKRPSACIDSWRQAHPDWEFRLWGNDDLFGKQWRLGEQMERIPEINGVADMMRWELLYKHGGFFVDADSVCKRPIPDWMCEAEFVTCYANEHVTGQLLACSFMGARPENELVLETIANCLEADVENLPAWQSVGPQALTNAWQSLKYPATVLPSHFFLPKHYSGVEYRGDLVFADHHWGSTHQSYGTGELA
jgi:mannosyltransferase OCH1-like enzyme